MTPRARQFRQLFFGALALFVIGMLSVTAYTLWRLHGDAISNGLDKAALHTHNTEVFFTQSLHVTELAAAHALPLEDGTPDLPRMARSFVTTLHHAPFLRSMSLLDAQGRIITSSNPANVGVTVSTLHYLPPSDGQQPMLRIGTPWAGRDFADGKQTSAQAPTPGDATSFIPITYTLVQGARAVTLLVALNPDYFLNHISQTLDGAEGSVEVLRFDGTRLMDSDPEAHIGVLHDDVVRVLGLPEVESGAFEQVLNDKQKSLTAFRASRLYPFVIVTHLDRQQTLQTWRTEAKTLLSVVVPVLLLICLLSALYYRRQLINAAHRAEAASAQRISATVFDASAAAITITDINANIISVNPAFTRMSGYSAAEVLGRNPRLMSSGLQSKPFYDHLWRDLLQHGVWQGEMLNRRKDGSLFNVQISITTTRDSQGRPQHFIGVSTDITERKRAEAEALLSTQLLLDATQEAQEANLAKSRFLATMSHEIRTPMNGILGMAQLLLMQDIEDVDRIDYTQTILTSGQSLLALLNDILDLSKIEAGKFQLDSTDFSPQQLIDNTRALFSGSAKAKNLVLKCQWRGPVGQRYLADVHRLGQMLSNLLGNAIKFTPQGHIQMKGTEIERTDTTALLEFSVSDTGIGIAADKLKLLFLPFSQTDSATTRQYGGSGLGLSIVSSLAKMIDGDVGVESVEGQGSRFWFRIRAGLCANQTTKLAAVNAGATPMAVPNNAAHLSGQVLVAEDNPVNAMVIKALLNKLGLTVTLLGDGQQALDAIRQGAQPDVVLMDLQMPVMDGLTATRLIRQWEAEHKRPRQHIIAFTADAFEDDRLQCQAAGMDGFLTKPVSLDALTAALGPWLGAAPAAVRPNPASTLRPLDRARFETLVHDITPLLANNRFDALTRFKDIVQLAQGTDLAAEIAMIDIDLKAFRFDLALKNLQRLAAMPDEKYKQ